MDAKNSVLFYFTSHGFFLLLLQCLGPPSYRITWLRIRRIGKVGCTMSSDSLCDVCNVSIQ
ncbi:hypothetical protein CY35_16G049600 [Sphagnum magellanicum]|nr:hypothetical protein CY35_16G049600 [Sphagnum magellanicum]